MNMYTVKRWQGKWEDVPSLDIAKKYRETPDTVTARAQIAFDDDNLYVRLETEEYEHRNVETGPVGSPCEDCCLEFFFSPIEGDTRYFNIELNSNGCMYLGMGHSMDDLVRLLPQEGAGIFSPKIEMKEGGWSVEYRIPVDFVKIFFPYFSLYAGKRMRANCYKCADETKPPHYLSWNPVTEDDDFTFHRSECFGEMIFAN